MKTIEVKLYSFSELSDKAKQIAIDQYRDSQTEYFWAEENRQSLEAFCNAFPVQVKNWSYDAQSHNESVLYIGDADFQTMSGPRLISYLINCNWPDLFEYKKYTLPSGKTRKSRITIVETSCPFTGYYMDEVLLSPVREYLKKPLNMDFEDLLTECVYRWGKACMEDCAYQISDEYIIETLINNDYDFTEDGKMY